jgi:predicted GNAT family N-acyltransferase
MTTLTIAKADWAHHSGILSELRHRVFVDEQGVPEALELDEFDATASHWIARIENTVVATARMLDSGAIGRMAVLKPYRGKGIGSGLLTALIKEAKTRKYPRLTLGAQEHAISFYERAGFRVKGPRFIDAGIAHQHMHLPLDTSLPKGFSFDMGLRANPAQGALNLCKNARWELRIFSHSLEPALFASAEFIRAVYDFAHRHQESMVRLMICDELPLRETHHPLVELSRQHRQILKLRTLSIDYTINADEYFMVSDEDHLLVYPHQSEIDQILRSDEENIARQYRLRFDHLWRQTKDPRSLKPFY